MADAKDILGLRQDGQPKGKAKVSKEPAQRKPEGVSREVYALTGGLPPAIMPAVEAGKGKKKAGKAVRWGWLPFTPAARKDALQLHHWVPLTPGAPAAAYQFDKFSRALEVPAFSDEEYTRCLQDPRWSREETEHLLQLARQYDLRFIVMADRWALEHPRSVEEMKERYYSVARQLLLARAHDEDDVADHPLVKEPFNVVHEVTRKKALTLLLSQSKEQEQEEHEVLAEAKRIAEARKPAAALLLKAAGPEATPTGTPKAPLKAATAVQPPITTGAAPSTGKAPPRMFVRGVRLAAAAAQAAQGPQGSRTAKRLEKTLEELGLPPAPRVPTRAVCGEYERLRKAIAVLYMLQKKVQQKEAEAAALRENPGTDVRLADGKWVQRSVSTRGTPTGAGVKRKGPHKASEQASPTMEPQHKRARKIKTHDD